MLLFEKFSSLPKMDDRLGAVYIQGKFDQMGFSIHLRYNHSTLCVCVPEAVTIYLSPGVKILHSRRMPLR